MASRDGASAYGPRVATPPAAMRRKLERLAARRRSADDALTGATAALAMELADANADGYSIATLALAIGLSKAATHALVVKGR